MRKSLSTIAVIMALLLTSVAAIADDAATSGQAVININTADASQFALLPRIGPKAAGAIVAYRNENGPFKRTTDLMQVKGVGDKTFELLSPYLVLEGKTTLTSKQQGPRRGKRASKTSSPQAQ